MSKKWKSLSEERWLKLESLVLNCHMLADFMSTANNQMNEKHYEEGAAGAFHLMAFALEEAHCIMDEYEE